MKHGMFHICILFYFIPLSIESVKVKVCTLFSYLVCFIYIYISLGICIIFEQQKICLNGLVLKNILLLCS